MKVSIVSIAKTREELKSLENVLKKQTFKDYEFVYSLKKGIPQAWNDAIRKSRGKIIIMIDSDARPLSNRWIEELVKTIKLKGEKTIVKSIEINPNDAWSWCGVTGYANVFKKNPINEKYAVAEDTEFFTRLHKKGYEGYYVPTAPVKHERNSKLSTKLSRSYMYGRLNTRILLKNGSLGFYGNTNDAESFFKREIVSFISRVLYITGVAVEYIIFKLRRKLYV